MNPTSFPVTLFRALLLLIFLTSGSSLKAQDATNTSGTTATSAERRQMFEQLGLSDNQKAQIKQIVQNTPKGPERRQQIMAVLTSDQKAQLVQEYKQMKTQSQ